jgi:hypothetical protein
VGLATKAFIPSVVDDDLTSQASTDPGNANSDDGDNDGNPSPPTDSTPCKSVRPHANFAKAILVTVELPLSHSLMPVHALAVSDAALEPMLPDRFLPNAETGPPVGARSCRSPCPSLSLPLQQPTIIISENGTTPRSSPWRPSL